MAGFKWTYDRDWNAAEEEYSRAAELDPSFGPSHAFLSWMGRYTEALAKVHSSREQLDPLSANSLSVQGWRYYQMRDYDNAIDYAQKALQQDPNHPEATWTIQNSYAAMGMFDKLIADASGRGTNQEVLASWQKAYDESGWEGFWRERFSEVAQSAGKPYDKARRYARMGEKDLAFDWLEKTYELPVGIYFMGDAVFDSLRDDPRIEELLRKLNLPEEAIQRHLALR
jgi:tetratricopeptide (TPR) repeat protein